MTRPRDYDCRANPRGGYAIRWFVPGMKRQVECPPVNGEHHLSLQLPVRVDGLLWIEMNVRPQVIIRANLYQSEIERAMLHPYGAEPGERARVARMKHTVNRALY